MLFAQNFGLLQRYQAKPVRYTTALDTSPKEISLTMTEYERELAESSANAAHARISFIESTKIDSRFS